MRSKFIRVNGLKLEDTTTHYSLLITHYSLLMAHKENKGGTLTNEQIEADLKAKGKTETAQGYAGSQDTGDAAVRQIGNEVQKGDGAAEGTIKNE